jgi:hypothetical protein
MNGQLRDPGNFGNSGCKALTNKIKSNALQQINGNIVLIVIDTDSCGISIDGIYKSNYHISYDLENPDISECAVV